MRQLPLHDDPRISLVRELIALASQADRPTQTFEIFGPRMWQLRPLDYFVSLSQRGLNPGEYKVTRRVRMDDVRAGDLSAYRSQNPWSSWASLPTHTGGILGHAIAAGEPVVLLDLDLADDPALGTDIAGMGSLAACPIFEQGKVLNWSIQFRRAKDGYTAREFEDLLLTANLIGSMTRSLVAIGQAKEANAALVRQFEEVARVQQSLLPTRTPDIAGLSIATSYLTSEHAGGDYYDFIRFPRAPGERAGPARWGVLIADVAGHGAAAATLMAMLRGILHCYPGPSFRPDDILAFANAKLVDAGLSGSFVTAFLAVYEPDTCSFNFCNAGHPPPRLRRGDGSVAALEGSQTFPVGVVDELEPGFSAVRLHPGDTLLLYTDGITEAMNPAREMFGEARLDQALAGCSGQPDCVIESVHAALFAHTNARTRADDQTLVALRFGGDHQ